MVKIRLFRTGAKNQPYYRVVATDSRKKRDGKIIEILGFFQPKSKKEQFTVNKERVHYWLQKGAQPTNRVRKLLVKHAKIS